MSYTEEDARQDAYYEELERMFQESRSQESREAVRRYLAQNGDAVDTRVQGAIREATVLLEKQHLGPALCVAATAIEVMIKFMILRPLVQGAFLSDDWAEILTQRVLPKRGPISQDRKLLPAVLHRWGVDVAQVPLWGFLQALFDARNKYAHGYEAVPAGTAGKGVETAEEFRRDVVGTIARQFGLRQRQEISDHFQPRLGWMV